MDEMDRNSVGGERHHMVVEIGWARGGDGDFFWAGFPACDEFPHPPEGFERFMVRGCARKQMEFWICWGFAPDVDLHRVEPRRHRSRSGDPDDRNRYRQCSQQGSPAWRHLTVPVDF